MSEVPSSTILAIVGLIAALLVIAFIIAAYSSTRNGADAIVLSQEKQKRYIEDSEYNVYQDEIFDGTQVMSTIKNTRVPTFLLWLTMMEMQPPVPEMSCFLITT